MKTLIWGHRGAASCAPENTLESFALADKQGADGIELDIQMTRDGQIVVCHDETLERVSNGSGKFRNSGGGFSNNGTGGSTDGNK